MVEHLFDSNPTANHTHHAKNSQWPDHYAGRLMSMFGFFTFFRSEENHKHETEHVEGGENRHKPADGKQPVITLRDSLSKNGILAEETAQGPHARKCNRADKESPI